jgi:alpha-1,3-rhamnosyl/mannosyltransferase
MIGQSPLGHAPVVAVNLMWCRPGGVGGSEEYLCRQMLGLPESRFDVVIYAPKGFRKAHPEVADRHTVIEMSHDAESRTRRIFDESTWLYRRTKSSRLVHHGGGTIPLRHREPTVLTVHDLQYLEYPQYFSRRRLEYLRRTMPRAIAQADVITVPTQFVRRSIVHAFDIDPDGVVVVPHGVESTFGTEATLESELRSKYRLGDGPIVVYPAVTHPHKGHEFLLDVQEKYWVDQGVTLVLMGGIGAIEEHLQQRVSGSQRDLLVRRLGRVSDADRDGLIGMARALVFPSEYEGFGAPVIEAMALGTPVVASDRACVPEVVGRAGLVIELDVDSWGGALEVVESRRDELIDLGRQRCEHFTSTISGEALADAYDRLLD